MIVKYLFYYFFKKRVKDFSIYMEDDYFDEFYYENLILKKQSDRL